MIKNRVHRAARWRAESGDLYAATPVIDGWPSPWSAWKSELILINIQWLSLNYWIFALSIW